MPTDFGIHVIGEGDVGSNKDVVFNGDSGGYENKGSYLAVVSDDNFLFYVYKGVYFAVLSNLALEKVYLIMYDCSNAYFDVFFTEYLAIEFARLLHGNSYGSPLFE